MKQTKIYWVSLHCFWKLMWKNTLKNIVKTKKMIDTVILRIQKGAYRILDHSRFGLPVNTPEQTDAGGFRKFANNPTIADKERGYYPRLTLERRAFSEDLKMEFSVPKLLYGNNLEELSENDFEVVLNILLQRIREMGVLINSRASLSFADVSTLHVAKNIPLSGGHTSNYIIKELHKIDLLAKFDLDEGHFRNGGHSLQCYAESNSLVFYDKIAEIFRPLKRKIETDGAFQPTMFDTSTEVMRIEARITNKNKLNALLEKFAYTRNPLFKDVFRKELCQKLLLHYWHTMIADKNRSLFHPLDNPQRLYAIIQQGKRHISPKEAIYLIGLNALTKDRGMREFKTLAGKHSSKRTWARIKRDIARLGALQPSGHGLGFIDQIEKALTEFKPYKPGPELKKLST